MNKNLSSSFKKTVFILTIVLATIFALLFHKEDRLQDLLYLIKPDHISVLYLKLLLNVNPDNVNLHLELARHYINLGEDAKARFELGPLQAERSPVALEARLMMLEIDFKDYFSIAEDDPNREIALADIQNSIIEISKNTIPLSLFPKIIKLSLELNQPAVAANLYFHWSTTILDPAERLRMLQESAKWYIAAGLPKRAAEIYHKCYELSESAVQAKHFAIQVLRQLRAAGEIQYAAEYFLSYQTRFPKAPELLDEMIAIYLADNKQKFAYKIGSLRLTLDPDNPEQIKKQIERALAVEELLPALALAKRLIEIIPDDDNAHERLANIAEWAAKPDLALREWLWLARNRKDEAAIMNTIRLAKGLYFINYAIEMLGQLSKQRELDGEEIDDLLFAYREGSNLFDPIYFLKSFLKRYPNNLQAWEALAKAQEDAGQLAESIATWQHIGVHFNQLIEAVVYQAKLEWKNNQSEKAFSLLLLNIENATERDTHFWEIFGELSWNLEQADHSFLAYSILWRSGKTDVIVAERLIQLMQDSGKAEEAIAVCEEAYDRFNEPRWLLLSLDIANQANLPTQLKRLLKIAISNESEFQESEMYWLLRAQVDIQENKPEIAINHYQRALRVSPASTTAKEGILWTLIRQNNRRSLHSYIKIWRTDALDNSLLWGAYGVALGKIGQYKEALPWFERKLQASPDDYLWLLTYADILGHAGYADKSWRMRKHVLFNLRSRFAKNESEPEKREKDLFRPEYLALVRDMEGSAAEVSLLKKYLAKGPDDPVVQEMLVAAYLSQENYSAARYWLLQDHIARQKTPAWQRLTLALAENDLATAADILENENDKLTEFNKMEALKRLNRNEEALALTYDLLDSHKEESTAIQAYLFHSRDELAMKSSKQFIGSVDYKILGKIDFTENRARFNLPYYKGIFATELKHTLLNSSDPNIILSADNEVDISAEFKHPLKKGAFQLNLGGNVREDTSLIYGAAKVSQDITNKIKTSLRLGLKEISYETGALRALGAKDTILLGVSAQPTPQTFMNLDFDGHRYLTREGNTLGKGYKLQMILGRSLVTGIQDWQIRIQGSWENNHLERTLPSELFSTSITDVETLIAKRFTTLGAGTTFRYGASEQGVLRRPFILADAWTGWVWPADELGYNGRISVGISLLGSDVLSAGAFYSNIQGGKTNQAYRGVGLQYSIRF